MDSQCSDDNLTCSPDYHICVQIRAASDIVREIRGPELPKALNDKLNDRKVGLSQYCVDTVVKPDSVGSCSGRDCVEISIYAPKSEEFYGKNEFRNFVNNVKDGLKDVLKKTKRGKNASVSISGIYFNQEKFFSRVHATFKEGYEIYRERGISGVYEELKNYIWSDDGH